MSFSPGPASFIRGPKSALPSTTRGGSRVPEWGPLGSVRGALSNERPYRDLRAERPRGARSVAAATSGASSENRQACGGQGWFAKPPRRRPLQELRDGVVGTARRKGGSG